MKNYNIKSKYKSTLALVLVGLATTMVGCKKGFLDQPTQAAYTEANYPYLSGSGPYDGKIYACYNGLRGYGVSAIAFVMATSIRSEDADKGSTAADGPNAKQFDDFTITPANGQINGMWVAHYDIIQSCNLVLKAIKDDKSPLTDPGAKISAEAEARFIRGYTYFMLVRYFGNIPLKDSIPDDQTVLENTPQSTPAQIYAFIEDDLRFAAANLPPSWPKEFNGRATKGSANGILAKVYLTQKKWSAAKSAAEMVIDSKQYDLKTPYSQIFGESGENSSESVFEIQATKVQGIANATYGVQYAADQGVRGGAGDWNLGNGFNVPSENLEAAYEPGDPRKARTILYAGGTSVYNETLPSALPNPRYNHKVLSNPSFRAKYLDRFGWWMNVRILRYADVVLMYAEAANEIGGDENIASARKYLNEVRERARGGNNSILPDVTTDDQNELREAIRHERRIELAMEHDRFFDLVRWGIAKQVLHAAGKTNYKEGRDELIPIPQTQIDISGGVLKPNPGY